MAEMILIVALAGACLACVLYVASRPHVDDVLREDANAMDRPVESPYGVGPDGRYVGAWRSPDRALTRW